MWYVLPFYILIIVLVVVAWLRGQAPERAALVTFVTAALLSEMTIRLSFYAKVLTGSATVSPALAVAVLFVIDAAVIAALILVAVRWQRRWPLWAAAFQTISTLAHLGRLVDPGFNDVVFAAMESFSAYPTMLLLAWALYRHPRRRVTT